MEGSGDVLTPKSIKNECSVKHMALTMEYRGSKLMALVCRGRKDVGRVLGLGGGFRESVGGAWRLQEGIKNECEGCREKYKGLTRECRGSKGV